MLTNINISDFNLHSESERKKWMVVYTKSRREKKIAKYCQMFNYKYYLPLEQKTKIYGRKKVRTIVPLFPGYLFCCADDIERYELLLTHDIAKILYVSDQSALLCDLAKIFRIENADLPLNSCESVQKGQRVRIKTGPLRSIEGIISEVRGKNRLFLEVDAIQRVASVEINQELVESIN